ncbi:hypothetical protein F4814DRAFT_441208 [Daldinia grandis]|nr:hypothetical protein F4814DRAFT_441208 [Daldinia grandis]
MPIQRIYIFDGTWASRNSKRESTTLSKIVEILSVPGSQQEIKYFSGPGTRYGVIDKYLGGCLGYGIENHILEAIDDLAINYSPKDEVIIIGYSRGAYIARCVAGFLNRLGLPQCRSEDIHLLYGKYTSGQLLQRGVANRLSVKYKCRQITIKCLICIDTVGSLGIPSKGFFGLFHVLSPIMKKYEFLDTDIGPNIDKVFHALALHEYRAPFQPTLMHVPEHRRTCLKQVYFLGSHGDVGRLSEGASLGDITLAWILQHLRDIGIVFNQDEIDNQFPRPSADYSLTKTQSHNLAHYSIRRSSTYLWKPFGRYVRRPGHGYRDGWVANETIHASVRLHDRGLKGAYQSIPGYSIRMNEDQTYSWCPNIISGIDCIAEEPLAEEPLGDYEAWLHGITLG